jgi:PAS domain S-box-containing protein
MIINKNLNPSTEMKALEHSHELMQYIIEHARSAIAVHDRDLNYIYVSQRYLQDYKVEEPDVIGKHHYDVFPDLPQKWRDVHQRALAGEVLSAEDDPYEREDGSVDWTRWECRPWYEADGSIGGIIVYTEVITERKQVAESLSKSEERFKLAMRATNEGLYDWNMTNNEVYYSPAWKSMLGYEYDELPNELSIWTELTKPEDVNRVSLLNQKIIDQRLDKVAVEFQMKHKDGHWVDIQSRAFTIYDEKGNPLRMVGTHSDITRRKHTELKIKNAELLLRSSLESQKDTIIFSIDKNYHYLYFNKAHKDVMKTAYKKDIVTGMDILECITSDDDRQVAKENYDRALAGETHSNIREYGNEKRGYFESFFNPILNDKNEIVGATALAMDITGRKQAEEELTVSRQQLIDAQQLSNVGSWSYDPVTQKPIWSGTMFSIWGLDPQMGAPEYSEHQKYIHPDDFPRFDAAVAEAVELGKPYKMELRICRPDGTESTIITICEPRLDTSGKVISLVGTNQDITERKQAEQERIALEAQLLQSQKLEAVGTMVNGIAHEFNNVLQGIFLYGGILEGQLQDDRSKASLKAMMVGSERAKKIVNQIMAFSRQSEENIANHNLWLILREAIDLEKAMVSSQIEIVEEIADDCSQIRCDSTQMQQIIINLCNNAQQAMPDGGTLTVGLKEIQFSNKPENGDEKKVPAYLELSISDTGTGMDNETLEKVFDPFFTTKEVGEGTGLGLSVVHGLIEQMGGMITATSKLGEGSTFTILLPTVND